MGKGLFTGAWVTYKWLPLRKMFLPSHYPFQQPLIACRSSGRGRTSQASFPRNLCNCLETLKGTQGLKSLVRVCQWAQSCAGLMQVLSLWVQCLEDIFYNTPPAPSAQTFLQPPLLQCSEPRTGRQMSQLGLTPNSLLFSDQSWQQH